MFEYFGRNVFSARGDGTRRSRTFRARFFFRLAQKFVGRNAEKLRKAQNRIDVGRRYTAFPVGNRLKCKMQLVCKFCLGQFFLFSKCGEVFAEFALFHKFSLCNHYKISYYLLSITICRFPFKDYENFFRADKNKKLTKHHCFSAE